MRGKIFFLSKDWFKYQKMRYDFDRRTFAFSSVRLQPLYERKIAICMVCMCRVQREDVWQLWRRGGVTKVLVAKEKKVQNGLLLCRLVRVLEKNWPSSKFGGPVLFVLCCSRVWAYRNQSMTIGVKNWQLDFFCVNLKRVLRGKKMSAGKESL